MKKPLIILSCLFLFNCTRSSKNTCERSKIFKLDDIEVSLPACYELYYPDTLEKNNFFLVRGDSTKLEISTDGLVTLEAFESMQNDKSLNIKSDTIQNHLRQVGYATKGDKYFFFVNIINLKREDHTVFDLPNDTSSILKNHRHYGKLMVKPVENGLSRDEVEIFVTAFRKSNMISKKPSH